MHIDKVASKKKCCFAMISKWYSIKVMSIDWYLSKRHNEQSEKELCLCFMKHCSICSTIQYPDGDGTARIFSHRSDSMVLRLSFLFVSLAEMLYGLIINFRWGVIRLSVAMNTIGSLNAPLKWLQIPFQFYRKQNSFVCQIQHRPFAGIHFSFKWCSM